MTVGEKIQFYRNKVGLSQEKLGQKILVSPQTVCLWEMDKALPTIDNLLLLKEVFSVSIDDILSKSEPIEKIENQPKETYIFKFEKADLQEIYKNQSFSLFKRALMCSIALIILWAYSVLYDAHDLIIGGLLGFSLLIVIAQIKAYYNYKKAWKSVEDKILQNTYSYKVFDEYFILSISKNEEISRIQKFSFDDIEKVSTIGKYLILQIAGQSLFIKKDALISNSLLISSHNNYPRKLTNNTEEKKPTNILKFISTLLFVLSICTIFGGLIGVSILTEIHQTMVENMWICFVFLPIPLASIVFGIYLKKQGYKYIKNIIVGIIMAMLLCAYGSFTFIFANTYSHSEDPIIQAEHILNIDIPQHSHISTQDWTKGTQAIPRGYIYYTSDIYFDNASVEEFEKNISSDEKWISKIPSDLVCISSFYCDMRTSDYYIIYNKDTKEFNKLPDKNGSYEFLNILYNVENNTMVIVEYRVEYVKN